jgi:hypothetical protein
MPMPVEVAKERFEHQASRQWGWWLRSTRRVMVALAFWWLVPATFVGLAGWGTYETMVKLPRDYSSLEQRGIRFEATFAGCTRGLDETCRLRLPERPTVWQYAHNHQQFDGLAVGDPVEVVVDPEDPARRYTALDLQRHTNEGFGVLFMFSILLGIAGVVGVPFLVRFSRTMVREAQLSKAPIRARNVSRLGRLLLSPEAVA